MGVNGCKRVEGVENEWKVVKMDSSGRKRVVWVGKRLQWVGDERRGL